MSLDDRCHRTGLVRQKATGPLLGGGTWALTAGAATMGRAVEALQDVLLNQGFVFVSSQDQERILAYIRGIFLACTGGFLGLLGRMVESGFRPGGRKLGCGKLQRHWRRFFWARREMSCVRREEWEWRREQTGEGELLACAARGGTTSVWKCCLLFGFHTLAYAAPS